MEERTGRAATLVALAAAGAGGDGGRVLGPSGHDEYPVHPRKVEFERLLLREADRLGCRQPGRKARLRCLAGYCSGPAALAAAGESEALSGSTLWRNLKIADPPSWPTLHKLVAGTGVPLVYWQLALGQLSTEQLAAALGQQTPQEVLSRLERRLLRGIRRLSPSLQERLLDLAEAIATAEPGPPTQEQEEEG